MYKRTLMIIGELAIALALVAIFFSIFIGIYSVSFPDATGLGGIIRSGETGNRGELSLEMDGQAEDSTFTASLSSVRNTVKIKPADGIVWSNARIGSRLGDRHAVQSYARSGATISFGNEGKLRLGQNSLVVIRENRRAARTNRRRSTVVLLDGVVHGELNPSQDEPLALEIAGATGSLSVESGSDQVTEFKVTANTDDSSTFAVYSGGARLESAGESIELQGNQFITIDPDGTVRAPRDLPPPPAAELPADRTVLTSRGPAPVVEFLWEPREVDSCRFTLARDSGFVDVVHEVVTADTMFRHGGLPPGTYFWRVSGFDGLAESPASEIRQFEIRLDQIAPVLEVAFPEEPVDAAVLNLAGISEPGVEIYVGDLLVEPAADGSFTHTVRLEPGLNVVVVEAVDPAGNSSYVSGMVQARYSGSEKKI